MNDRQAMMTVFKVPSDRGKCALVTTKAGAFAGVVGLDEVKTVDAGRFNVLYGKATEGN